MIARVETADPWREHRLLLTAVLTMALVVLVYRESFLRMVGMWTLTDYQYGWLVYPISLYILWRKRSALAGTAVQTSWLGVVLTAALVAIWLLARSVGVQAVEFASASLMTLSIFWAVAGTPAVRVALFPLALLVAAVPTGEFLVVHLQQSTADISSGLLHLFGVPAYREGLFLTLPGGSFEVADVCGGLRYLLAATMASLAYAYLTYTLLWKRALFVAVAAATMVVANGVRAFIVMYVASATEMQIFGGRDHVWFGMILFAAVFAGLIYVGDRYAERRRPAAGSGAPFLPESRASIPVISGALLIVAAGPVLAYFQARQPAPPVLEAGLPSLPGCRGPADWLYDWSPKFRDPDVVRRASYECGRHSAGVYFASYASHAQGKELISSANRVWPHDWRRYVEQEKVILDAGTGGVEVRQVHVRAPGRSMLIWYWYQVGNTTFSGGAAVKLATAARALAFQPVETSVFAVQVEGDVDAPAEELREVLEPKAAALRDWYLAGRGAT